MKKRVLSFTIALILASGSLAAQTLTDVINEFNAGVESLNGQAYETALDQFNNTLALCEQVGDEAEDMKQQAREQVVGTHYRQAITLMKRKQYDQALPALEQTVATSAEFGVKPEFAEKAQQYLPPLYLREGNVLLKQSKFDEAMEVFDKAIALKPDMYKAHQGKGLVHKEQGDIEKMLEEFDIAKTKAIETGDNEAVDEINAAIDGYYRTLIEEEMMMMDTEDPDYTFLLDICDQAIAANDKNGYAYWQAAMARNKMIEFDTAIGLAKKGLEGESDPVLRSALNYELGIAYQNTANYEEACAAYNSVTEEPFLSRAEKKLETPQLGCN
jgi:tetratricopeptide (TPR) repeat protein